jgi:hypothetical protein
MPSEIKRQPRGFAEGPFIIFENLRARKTSYNLLTRGSGCASFAPFTLRSGTSTPLPCCIAAHTKPRTLSTTVVLIEPFA